MTTLKRIGSKELISIIENKTKTGAIKWKTVTKDQLQADVNEQKMVFTRYEVSTTRNLNGIGMALTMAAGVRQTAARFRLTVLDIDKESTKEPINMDSDILSDLNSTLGLLWELCLEIIHIPITEAYEFYETLKSLQGPLDNSHQLESDLEDAEILS